MSLKTRVDEYKYRGGRILQPIKKRRNQNGETNEYGPIRVTGTRVIPTGTHEFEPDRGWQTEQRFEQFIRKLIGIRKNFWIKGIRKASKMEDRFGGYDFVLTLFSNYGQDHTYEVAIDTKSSYRGVIKYRHKRGNNGVFPIVASADMISDKRLRSIICQIWLKTRKSHPHFDSNWAKD